MEHLYSHNHHFPFEGPPLQIPNRRRTQMRFNSPDMDYEMVTFPCLSIPNMSSNPKSLKLSVTITQKIVIFFLSLTMYIYIYIFFCVMI